MKQLLELPKAEIHCHLEGIIDGAMARVIRAADPAFPVDADALDHHPPFADWREFFRWFEHQRAIMGDLTRFYPVLDHHIRRLKRQRVRYTEIMIGMGRVLHDLARTVDSYHALREWTNQREEGVIQVEYIAAIGRNHTMDYIERVVDPILALYEAGLIVGVALAGPEPENPVAPLQPVFARFHEAGLPIEIHAGEWVGPESVWDALNHGYPTRIGHGIAIFQDRALVETIIARGIHVELCPTSNIKTHSVEAVDFHPIWRARDLGMNFSVNTDDPGAFACSMNSEYVLLAQAFGFTLDDFRRIYANTLAARFQAELRVEI